MTNPDELEALAGQEARDAFYWKHGPCCAGCDWWDAHNSSVGGCRKSAPVSGAERAAMLGIEAPSILIGSGHPFTNRSHHCGDFRDEFDWSSLPLAYRKRIGAPIRARTLSPLSSDTVEGGDQ